MAGSPYGMVSLNQKADLQDIKTVIRSILTSSPRKVTIRSLQKDYFDLEGREIPLFGHKNLLSFLKSIPDICQIEEEWSNSDTGTYFVKPVMVEEIKHIEKLVLSQKTGRERERKRSDYRSNAKSSNVRGATRSTHSTKTTRCQKCNCEFYDVASCNASEYNSVQTTSSKYSDCSQHKSLPIARMPRKAELVAGCEYYPDCGVHIIAFERIVTMLRDCPHGIYATEFAQFYQARYGQNIRYAGRTYTGVRELFELIPHIFKVRFLPDNDIILHLNDAYQNEEIIEDKSTDDIITPMKKLVLKKRPRYDLEDPSMDTTPPQKHEGMQPIDVKLKCETDSHTSPAPLRDTYGNLATYRTPIPLVHVEMDISQQHNEPRPIVDNNSSVNIPEDSCYIRPLFLGRKNKYLLHAVNYCSLPFYLLEEVACRLLQMKNGAALLDYVNGRMVIPFIYIRRQENPALFEKIHKLNLSGCYSDQEKNLVILVPMRSVTSIINLLHHDEHCRQLRFELQADLIKTYNEFNPKSDEWFI